MSLCENEQHLWSYLEISKSKWKLAEFLSFCYNINVSSYKQTVFHIYAKKIGHYETK